MITQSAFSYGKPSATNQAPAEPLIGLGPLVSAAPLPEPNARIGVLEMTEWKLPEAYGFDGRTVRYGIRGNGPPVIAVHGTPWSSFNLRHLIDALSKTFTVYYYDLVGYGQSDNA